MATNMSTKQKPVSPAVNGAIKGSNPPQNKGKAYYDREKKITELWNEHVKDVAGRTDYEGLQKEVERQTQVAEEAKRQAENLGKQLQDERSASQKEVADMKFHTKALLDDQGHRFLAWEEEKKRYQHDAEELSRVKNELGGLQEKLSEVMNERDGLAGENAQLRKDVSARQKEVERQTRDYELKAVDYQRLKLWYDQLKDKLSTTKETLNKANKDWGILPFDLKTMEDGFDNLANSLHDLVWKTFGTDQSIGDNAATIAVSRAELSWIPQVASNSQAARYMRCALAETVIAETLSRDIFSDASLAGGKDEWHPLIAIIEQMRAEGYGFHATNIRCQLVRVLEKSDATTKIADRASGHVCRTLGPWLGGDSSGVFSQELKQRFSEAVELWQRLQRTGMYAKVIANVDDEDGEWSPEDNTRKEYNESEGPVEDPRSSMIFQYPDTRPVVILFPQIQASKGLPGMKNGNLVFHGYALFSTQHAFAAAWKEARAQPVSRRHSTVDRRGPPAPERQRDCAEAARLPHTRRMRTSSRDGAQERSVLGTRSDLSFVSSSSQGRADAATSVSSTRSRRSASGVGGGG